MLSDYHAEGVVFAGSGYIDDPRGPELAAAVERARERGIRVVALAMRDFDAPRIRADNHGAAFDVTDYVLSLGHRDVAFIGGPPALYASRDREQGFREAMAAAGADPERIYEGDFSYERGYAATLQMIAEPEPPEAIIGANDETAVGALAALAPGAHRRARGRISVAGMTDTRTARFSDMTTVSVPMYQFGAAAAQRIVAERGRARRDRPAAPCGAALDDGEASSACGGAANSATGSARELSPSTPPSGAPRAPG